MNDQKGKFFLKEVSERQAEMTFNFTSKMKSVTNDVTFYMETMEGSADQGYYSGADEGIMIHSIEQQVDSAQLLYFIPKADALFIRDGQKAYIQAKLFMLEPEQESERAGYI